MDYEPFTASPDRDDRAPFPQRAREARIAANMTQDWAAYYLRIGRSHMVNLEAGRVMPSMPLFVRMVNLYKVSPTWLLGGPLE